MQIRAEILLQVSGEILSSLKEQADLTIGDIADVLAGLWINAVMTGRFNSGAELKGLNTILVNTIEEAVFELGVQ